MLLVGLGKLPFEHCTAMGIGRGLHKGWWLFERRGSHARHHRAGLAAATKGRDAHQSVVHGLPLWQAVDKGGWRIGAMGGVGNLGDGLLANGRKALAIEAALHHVGAIEVLQARKIPRQHGTGLAKLRAQPDGWHQAGELHGHNQCRARLNVMLLRWHKRHHAVEVALVGAGGGIDPAPAHGHGHGEAQVGGVEREHKALLLLLAPGYGSRHGVAAHAHLEAVAEDALSHHGGHVVLLG